METVPWASVGSLSGGLLFGIGWMLWVDGVSAAHAEYGKDVNGAYWIPGVLQTISLLMVNAINWQVLSDSGLGDDGVAARVKWDPGCRQAAQSATGEKSSVRSLAQLAASARRCGSTLLWNGAPSLATPPPHPTPVCHSLFLPQRSCSRPPRRLSPQVLGLLFVHARILWCVSTTAKRDGTA